MRPTARVLVFLALLALILAGGPRAFAAPPAAGAADLWRAERVPGELLVGFRGDIAGVGAPGLSASFDRYLSAFGVRAASPGLGDGRTYRLRFATDDELRARSDALLRDPAVAFAEPNLILTLQGAGAARLVGADPRAAGAQGAPLGPKVPNDANYGQQWGPAKIGADRVWSGIGTGNLVVVAMLDTGISPTHPDLKERVLPGKDFVNADDDASDDNGHGTFTAGVVGATGNNGIGVAGISWGAQLLPVKILDQEGRGPVSAFAEGIRYAVDQGARIVNISAGVPLLKPSQAMESSVAYAIGKGAIVVAASGNSGKLGNDPNYPAAYPNVIAVGASTITDEIADFSSYGSYVSVAAPGQDIVSTYFREGDTYAQLSGTSASTPFVSGTIALMLSQRGALTPKTVREILKATAVDIGPPGYDTKSGYGRLDAFHATILATDPASATLRGAAVTPPSGRNTDPFILTATGFNPNEAIAVWIIGSDGTYRYYRYPQVYADANGAIQVGLGTSEPLPTSGANDTVQVLAYGEASQRLAATSFKVTQSVNTRAFAPIAPIPDTAAKVYFEPTGHTLGNAFLRYWRANGGLAVFGYPISEEFPETSPTDGKPYMVQYFQRNRFEYHPENAGGDFEVLLGLLGSDTVKGRTFDQALAPYESSAGRMYFPETKHSLTGDFLQYWNANGGLAVFGYPLCEPFQEISKTDGKPYLVQYFERNRFELHPENDPPFRVLLGLLGTDAAKRIGYLDR